MTKFKIGDEVYLKAIVSNIDDSTAPYNIAISLGGGHLTYCWVDEKHLIPAGRVEIKPEHYKFGDEVEVRIGFKYVKAKYVCKTSAGYHTVLCDSGNITVDVRVEDIYCE